MAEIYNDKSNTLLSGTSGNDVVLNGGWWNDSWHNGGSFVTIAGGKGNDYIENLNGSKNSINGGDGNDEINSWTSHNATINSGNGDDFIFNRNGTKNLINAGAGKDTIESFGWKMTIAGGKGNDSLSLNSTNNLIKYNAGDGNDTILGFNSTDTLTILGGSYSTATSGSDVIVTVGKGIITLKDVKGNAININGKNVGEASTNAKFIPLTSGNDTLMNNLDNVTISGLGGNDTLENDFGKKVSLVGGAGNDSIGSYANLVWNADTNSYDTVDTPDNVTINGGTGNDYIFNDGGKKVVFEYVSGDGNDTILGFNSTSTLSIGGGSYSTAKSGDNIIVTVGDGKISLMGAASLSSVNITSDYLNVTNSTKSPVTVGSAVKTIDASKRTKAVKITGNALANSIVGGSKNDSLYGGSGNDSIRGGKGNDKLYGQAGNDKLYGGAGNDTLTGGKGNDSLWGDAGKDTFIYSSGDGKDVIYGFDNNDMLKITGTFSASYSKSKDEVYFKVGSTSKAITLKDFSATSFNVNGTAYKISGTKLVK